MHFEDLRGIGTAGAHLDLSISKRPLNRYGYPCKESQKSGYAGKAIHSHDRRGNAFPCASETVRLPDCRCQYVIPSLSGTTPSPHTVIDDLTQTLLCKRSFAATGKRGPNPSCRLDSKYRGVSASLDATIRRKPTLHYLAVSQSEAPFRIAAWPSSPWLRSRRALLNSGSCLSMYRVALC